MSFAETASNIGEPVSGSGGGPMTRPEQNAVAVVRKVVHMFLKPKNMVLYPCIETRATAISCLPVSEQRDLKGCEL